MGKPASGPLLHGLFETFLDGLNEFAGDYTAHNGVVELEAGLFGLGFFRTQLKHDVAELTAATGLLLVGFAVVYFLGENLLVGHHAGRPG